MKGNCGICKEDKWDVTILTLTMTDCDNERKIWESCTDIWNQYVCSNCRSRLMTLLQMVTR